MYKLWWLLRWCFLFLAWSVCLAVLPAGFVVEVQPSNFAVNEAVDVTIKAINNDGTIVADYTGFVFVDLLPAVAGWSLSYDDIVLPWEWLVLFDATDLWQKTFSKSLIIRRAGSYIFRVYDISDESIDWQREVVVWQVQEDSIVDISIVSPAVWSVESMPTMTVLADASNLSNAPFMVLLNGDLVATGNTQADWSINTTVMGMDPGINTLQIRVMDLNDVVIWQSSPITFTYQSSTDEFFYGMEILPWTVVKQWDKLVFSVETSDAVSSAELILWSGTPIPMDRESIWLFVKQVTMESYGSLPVSLRLNAGGNMKLYQDLALLTIDENIAIWLVQFYTQSLDRTSLVMSWEVIGQASRFRINYGIDPNDLNEQMSVDTTEIEILNIDPNRLYYFQITPMSAANAPIGTPSNIKEIDPSALQAQVTCIVDGIMLDTEEIDGAYYLVWEPVENAINYIIYRSDELTSLISDMRKVTETTQTRFEYPFNPNALNEEFAYYAVLAVCADGKEILVDQIKKVEVWPYDSLFVAIILSLLLYSMWSLYKQRVV